MPYILRYSEEKNTEKLVNFSDRFKKLMDESGLTQTAAAKIFGVSQGAIFDYREGRSEPKSWPLIRMAKYFGVTVEWLMTGEDNIKDDTAMQMWKDRALDAERKLEIARDALKGALKDNRGLTSYAHTSAVSTMHRTK